MTRFASGVGACLKKTKNFKSMSVQKCLYGSEIMLSHKIFKGGNKYSYSFPDEIQDN